MKVSDKDLDIPYSREIDVSVENYPTYSNGINRPKINRLKRLEAEGYDQFQVAHSLQVVQSVIKSFWPKKMGKPRNNAAA